VDAVDAVDAVGAAEITGLAGPGAGTAIRVAVTVPFETVPRIATDWPGMNWARVAGAFLVPNWVWGVMVTTRLCPALVRTVQVDADSLTIVPRAPLRARAAECAFERALGLGVAPDAGAVADVEAAPWEVLDSPAAANATPTPAPIAASAVTDTIRGVRCRTGHDFPRGGAASGIGGRGGNGCVMRSPCAPNVWLARRKRQGCVRKLPLPRYRARYYRGVMLLALVAILVILLIVLPIIGIALWALVSVGFVGVIIGGLARLVLPGRQNIGLLATVLLGWIGSIIGGFIGYHVIHTGSVLTVLLEVGVAALLVAVYSGSQARSGSRRNPSLRW
jgi:uncharacterized membrane protein YeaQ/YmgE (transglycosylase-associated protein family)